MQGVKREHQHEQVEPITLRRVDSSDRATRSSGPTGVHGDLGTGYMGSKVQGTWVQGTWVPRYRIPGYKVLGTRVLGPGYPCATGGKERVDESGLLGECFQLNWTNWDSRVPRYRLPGYKVQGIPVQGTLVQQVG